MSNFKEYDVVERSFWVEYGRFRENVAVHYPARQEINLDLIVRREKIEWGEEVLDYDATPTRRKVGFLLHIYDYPVKEVKMWKLWRMTTRDGTVIYALRTD